MTAQETVVPLTGQSSHQLGALAQANALIIVPEHGDPDGGGPAGGRHVLP